MSGAAKDPFYLVWNPERSVPSFKHLSSHDAIAEAKRLARTNPDQTFYVMETVVGFSVNNLQEIKFQRDDIPF